MAFNSDAIFDGMAANFLNGLAFANGPENIDLTRDNLSLRVKPVLCPPFYQPCANASRTVCNKRGTKTCTGCRMVSYCSVVRIHLKESGCSGVSHLQCNQECQNAHWKAHKRGRSALITFEFFEADYFKTAKALSLLPTGSLDGKRRDVSRVLVRLGTWIAVISGCMPKRSLPKL